ncbi:hypothetical protein ABT063_10415 [Streptomyces sp. NPDC002838]|uniref:hypothetical protein n=1 Tax=Streptomyces sp. NPDC002838 TaxID=3154436 RepID=UPI003316DABA
MELNPTNDSWLDRAPEQFMTIEEVLAQLHLVGSKAPSGEFDFDEEGLARLRAWMEAEHPADGDSTGPAEPAPE